MPNKGHPNTQSQTLTNAMKMTATTPTKIENIKKREQGNDIKT